MLSVWEVSLDKKQLLHYRTYICMLALPEFDKLVEKQSPSQYLDLELVMDLQEQQQKELDSWKEVEMTETGF